MPFTPYHLGPAFLFAALFYGILDVPAFVLASVYVDIEPFLILALGLPGPLHGFSHTLLGGLFMAAQVAFIVYYAKHFAGIEAPLKKIFFSAYAGVALHILLDAPLYGDVMPFYPIEENPLLGLASTGEVQKLCLACFALAVVVAIYRKRSTLLPLPASS